MLSRQRLEGLTMLTVLCHPEHSKGSPAPEGIMTAIPGGELMRVLLYVAAGLVFLSGFIFVLQGINILPGSFMTGDPQWAVNGALMMAVALVLFIFAGRRK